MKRHTSELLVGICAIVLVLLVAASIPAVWRYANRNAPLPGYGPNAYLGPVPGARLDVDRFGDPRYGGVIPEHVTVAELQHKVDYPVPKVPALGPPSRVDYWPDTNTARLVWLRPEGEVWLHIWRLPDQETLREMKRRLRWCLPGTTTFKVRGYDCGYATSLMGDFPSADTITPDNKLMLTFMSESLSLEQAKAWCKSYYGAVLRPSAWMARPGHRMNSIGMVLVDIPPGRFLMGTGAQRRQGGDAAASPVHRVAVSGFAMGEFEVANAQFDRYKKRPRPLESQADSQPATRVSWNDAVKFCQWLSRKEGRHYRLPTEAEWEYAARGGLVQKDYPWGNEPARWRAAVLWPADPSLGFVDQSRTRPVGNFAPNGFGLHDMAGNVEEWVSDWYDPEYYAHSPTGDPQGPSRAPLRQKIARGGSIGTTEPYCWRRNSYPPDWRSPYVGFRVVLDPSPARPEQR